MASLRNLKKDIDYLVMQVISDCYFYIDSNPKKHDNEINAIIDDSHKLWVDLTDRANHPNGKHDKKLIKAHYTSLRKDMLSSVNDLFQRLSEIIK